MPMYEAQLEQLTICSVSDLLEAQTAGKLLI